MEVFWQILLYLSAQCCARSRWDTDFSIPTSLLIAIGGITQGQSWKAEAEQLREAWLRPVVWEPVSFPLSLAPKKATPDARLTLLNYGTPTASSYKVDSFLEEILSLM